MNIESYKLAHLFCRFLKNHRHYISAIINKTLLNLFIYWLGKTGRNAFRTACASPEPSAI